VVHDKYILAKAPKFIPLARRAVAAMLTRMLHPLIVAARRLENASSMPEWTGFGLHLAALVASGWMVVATLSRGAWVVGLVSGSIFVVALFMATGYLFPEQHR
jgi:hypothetical protein